MILRHIPVWVACVVFAVWLSVLAYETVFTRLQPEATLSELSSPVGWKTTIKPKIWGGRGWQWCSLPEAAVG